MNPTRLLRGLPRPFALPSTRPVASSNSSSSSSIFLPRSPHHIPKAPLHQTTRRLSSPFRLSSNNTNNTNSNNPSSPHYSSIHDKYAAYAPKRQWPPDMTRLSPKHQFRLERKYRRRAALKFARPKWVKATKLVQWGVIGFVLFYALLFMEWDDRGSPFDDLREAVFTAVRGAFSTPPPPHPPAKRSDGTREE